MLESQGKTTPLGSSGVRWALFRLLNALMCILLPGRADFMPGDLYSHAGLRSQEHLALSLMVCCCHLKVLNSFFFFKETHVCILHGQMKWQSCQVNRGFLIICIEEVTAAERGLAAWSRSTDLPRVWSGTEVSNAKTFVFHPILRFCNSRSHLKTENWELNP